MSSRNVVCPTCQVSLKVKNEITRFRCPKCQTAIQDVPALESSEPLGDSAWSAPAVDQAPSFSAATIPSPLGQKNFPALNATGPAVNPLQCVEPGTSLALGLGYVAVGLGILLLALSTFGFGLLLLLIAPIVAWFNRRKALAMIHGSGLQVSEAQFPEIDRCVKTLWSRLSTKPCPEVYIIEAAVMNAFAIRLGKKNIVLLTDEIIHGCLQSKDPRTLTFVLGHELGHAVLNHNSTIRTSLKQFKKLSRLDEYSADRVAMKLVGDSNVSVEGIVLLAVGPHLLPYINYEAIRKQANEVAANKQSKKAEKPLTHPLVLNRLKRAFG